MKLLLLLLLLQIYNYSSIACNVLSLSGGGSFGALELGILSSQRTPYMSYQLMTGVSVGGLNVGYLSYFNNINDGIDSLKDIYINMKNDDIYEFNFI